MILRPTKNRPETRRAMGNDLALVRNASETVDAIAAISVNVITE